MKTTACPLKIFCILSRGGAKIIDCRFFFEALKKEGIDFFAGVPDSLLSDFSAYITDHVAAENHLVAANEGNAVALAAGHYLASRQPGLVYMQNSGLGNALNPLVSLADPLVYKIPMLLLIGWRGKPQVADEPQHIKQGLVTLSLLEIMGLDYRVLPANEQEASETISQAAAYMHEKAAPFALVVEKDTFKAYRKEKNSSSAYEMSREEALRLVLAGLDPEAVIVSTTGKLSREIYEYREERGEGHSRDFLNVGSMGHASQIALGIALNKPERRVFCFDGDGAVIMHMGSLAISGTSGADNLYHLVFNNSAHDSVGGQATAGFQVDFPKVAAACGYRQALKAENIGQLEKALNRITSEKGPALLEIRVRKGARKDLGRPKTTPEENKVAFMNFLQPGN